MRSQTRSPREPGGELRLGHRDQLLEDLRLLLDARPAAEEDVDDLLEIEQPERQQQILRADDVGEIAEALTVFVVRVDQEDAEVRLLLQDLGQDERDRRRLADAGGAEDGEMLAQQLLEIDVGGDCRIEPQTPDLDGLAMLDAVDDGDVAGAKARDEVADRRIARHAALERRLRVP